MAVPATVAAAPTRAEKREEKREKKKPSPLGELVERVREAETVVIAAERAASKEQAPTEAQLAKQLVAGQLQLSEHDYERAAITFLDLLENYPQSQAAQQATHFLGAALVHMDMERWAAELFSKNLADTRPDARRFHQQSVAKLFDLAVPRRDQGFARKPGLSATPEVRARLLAVGLSIETPVPKGIVSKADAERLVQWAESFPRSDRLPELRYSYGRYLYLTKQHDKAIAELDSLSPLDIPISRGGPDAKWRVRAAYVAAAATLAKGEVEEALDRFRLITRAQPRDPRDRQIVELAWLAIGRIHHDTGEPEDAVKAYKRIGRDSPFFPEAMYETAWALLKERAYDRAVQALDLLLVYDPGSPIAPEIKQLRGKVKIQQRDYPGAEEEFLVLRRDFDRLRQQLGRKLQSKGDAKAYFAAVIGEDMEHFSLASILPVKALPVARGLDRAVHAESLAREVGYLERELAEIRELLARMEEAVQAREKARLFNDLGAHAAGLDNVDDDLIAVREKLVFRLAGRARGGGLDRMEGQRQALRDRLDEPLGTRGEKRRKAVAQLEHLAEQAHKLDLFIVAMRAELVATERYYEETRKDQKIDHQGYLTQAAQLRDAIDVLEKESLALRNKIARAKAGMRYRDPAREARDQALAAYRDHLQTMYAALRQVAPDPDADTVWKRVDALQDRRDKTRTQLERAATRRLQDAVAVLVEERANLDQYLVELGAVKGKTKELVASTLDGAYQDVVVELGNLVMRSEVGLLDVAWGMKEAETDEIQRLETERDRDLRELDRNVEMGLEDLE